MVTNIIEDTVTCIYRVPTIRPDWRLSGLSPPHRPGEHFVRPGCLGPRLKSLGLVQGDSISLAEVTFAGCV